MKPFVTPASTGNMFFATCITTVIVWVFEEFLKVPVPAQVAAAFAGIIVMIVGHKTTDTPPTPVLQEAIDKATDKADKAKEKS